MAGAPLFVALQMQVNSVNSLHQIISALQTAFLKIYILDILYLDKF